MKKILRLALPLGMLALAFSTSAKAGDCSPEYCDDLYHDCMLGCDNFVCVRQCALGYQSCIAYCG